ncbi:SdpI family protein [Pseudoglutamicibacter albus]|uniref:SdpI family protein n=1 Tax=Pseudoglutamicibacter albus TaxID=98671 RepID=UPI000557FACA|nr:SdpI family protein [Pseudoglutamicibacter albus]
MILFVFFLIDALLISLLAVWMARATSKGSLERNQLIGIRTKATLASDGAWDVAHKAAIPYMNAAAIIGFAGAALALLSLLMRPADGSLTGIHYAIPTVALALQVVILIWGSVIGNRRAKDVAS